MCGGISVYTQCSEESYGIAEHRIRDQISVKMRMDAFAALPEPRVALKKVRFEGKKACSVTRPNTT